MSAIDQLIQLHAALLEQNPYCYFELAYSRHTEWMAWICSDMREDNPNRIIHTRGQGSTPETACEFALKNYPITK